MTEGRQGRFENEERACYMIGPWDRKKVVGILSGERYGREGGVLIGAPTSDDGSNGYAFSVLLLLMSFPPLLEHGRNVTSLTRMMTRT